MCELCDKALARWRERRGWVHRAEMRSDEWKSVQELADEMGDDNCCCVSHFKLTSLSLLQISDLPVRERLFKKILM
jgi:hypothetical protein